jgi:hypothetical protein
METVLALTNKAKLVAHFQIIVKVAQVYNSKIEDQANKPHSNNPAPQLNKPQYKDPE